MFKRNLSYFYIFSIVLLSLLPLNADKGVRLNNFHLNIKLDSIIHMIMYVPLILLLIYGLQQKMVMAVLYGLVVAISTEGIQLGLPYRTFNINDLLANIFGLLIGLFLYVFYCVYKRLRQGYNNTF